MAESVIEDLSEMIITLDKAKSRLDEIESKLAVRFGITGHVREALTRMDRRGELVEDSLVADWHQAYASYLEFFSDD